MDTILELIDVGKRFTMHLQGGVVLPVVAGVSFTVGKGECVVLGGPSGAGKSSILKMIFGNYRCDEGLILIKTPDAVIDVATADPRRILALRHSEISYVSQFLRAAPRVSAIDTVAEPLASFGCGRERAREKSAGLLKRLNVPERLWSLPPATFSGGEQQRVNIARGFLMDTPLLLLDEPTASLDSANGSVVVDLITEKKRDGVAIIAIAHDDDVRDAIADRIVDISRFAAAG